MWWTEIWIPGDPPTVTQQQHRVIYVHGKPRFVPSNKLRKVRAHYAAAIREQKHMMHTGPVSVTISWCFPYRHSERRAITAAGAILPKDTRPDLDNLGKALLDELTGAGVIRDDSQIVEYVSRKCWCDTPGILIYVTDIDQVSFDHKIRDLREHAEKHSHTKCGSL